jgi:SpoVK/Ycf46/Vps4 family AAA+-type ATPase
MARSDLLISLVKAGTSGDATTFRKVVDAIIAEERGKKHDVLADRLADAATPIKSNGHASQRTMPSAPQIANDLFFEKTPRCSCEDLVLPEDVSIAVKELVEEQHRHDVLRSYGLEPRNRILLAGEPGNGKTSLGACLRIPPR